MKNLSFSQGDILVVQIDSNQFSQRYLSILVDKLHNVFDSRGITTILIPKDIEFSSVHIHRGNFIADGFKFNALVSGELEEVDKKEVVIGTDGKQYRMIRAEIEVIGLLKPSLPPSKKVMRLLLESRMRPNGKVGYSKPKSHC